jgi:4-diphosphocytidyl-2-C-methyl-D-erythritol kinase
VGENNLVYRAAAGFLKAAGIEEGIQVHLEKRIPTAAGLGGGSSDAATTLRGMNTLFETPLSESDLRELACGLGSDVPFFLWNRPALATGRGEKIEVLNPFPVLQGAAFLLIHPGFGVSTAWAYREMGRFPAALEGRPGRAQELVSLLQHGNLSQAGAGFYNALETPVLVKYPYLAMLKAYLRNQGAPAVLMSGSGSTVFAVLPDEERARETEGKVKAHFGGCWSAVVPIGA